MKEKGFDKDNETKEKQEKETVSQKQFQQAKNKSEEEHTEKDKIGDVPTHQKAQINEVHMKKNDTLPDPSAINNKDSRVEDDFKIQEDIILKLVDEDTPKSRLVKSNSEANSNTSNIQPPPNLGPPMQDQWFYQDPQGQMQGPFSSAEMAEWYKAGYFNSQLKVRRPCDELFYHLGELVTLCDGGNPFLSTKRFPPLKPDPTTLPEQDLLQYQYLMALKQSQTRATMPEPWNTLTLQQQQDVAAQRLIMHPQVSQELPFIHQSNTSNPLMHMINQMQQANKLPTPNLADKPPNQLPNQLDPRLVQLSNLHQLQNRLPPTSSIPNPLVSRLPGLTTDGLNLPGVLGTHPLTAMGGPNLGNSLNLPRPMSHNAVVDNLVPKPTDDPISSLLKQLQQQKQQQQQSAGVSLDSLWQNSQFPVPPSLPTHQWQQQEPPLSMWDISKPPELPPIQPEPPLTNNLREATPPATNQEHEHLPQQQLHHQQQQKQQERKDENSSSSSSSSAPKESRKKKEQEEKQSKKEADDKRKNEQRKLEAEKRASEERKKKEEDRLKKEMERAKKEAEEKRMRELEEKRRLKEQRKAEEEQKKKTEEQKKADEDRAKKEAREHEEYVKRETARLAQEQAIRNAKIAPWCQSSSTQGLSLQEIQKLEKEKARQEAVILQQQKQLQESLQQQQEKAAAGFTWATKTKENRQIKSLTEIQAEEQERLTKQAAEARLLALQKEKEQPPVIQNTGNIWNSQNLSWSTNSSNSSQWLSSNSTGLWEDAPGKGINNKPSKGNTTAAGKPQQQQQQQNAQLQHPQQQQQQQQSQKAKSKSKKDETANPPKNIKSSADEFTGWCSKTLSNITSEIDIPTFVTFLRDIESALDVREYCKEYLGDSPQTQQFASNFLEKRRSFRPKSQAPKDDMCSPAPAITPSSVHSNEFQEVKGKNKKNKKNKMLKVDNRILGFNVTSAPDRINVGDRDYGDNA